MKSHIVLIGNTSWSMYHFRGDLIKKFLSLGHKVTVISPEDNYTQKIIDTGSHWIDIKLDRKGTNPIKELFLLLQLIRKLIEIKPDITLCYTIKPVIYGSIASRLAGSKQRIAITTGLGYTFSYNNLTSKFAKTLYKLSLKFSNEVWFLNKDDINVFIQNKLVNPTKAFHLQGEGIDLNHYQLTNTPDSIPTFTLIARMLWDKGVGVYIDAAKAVKEKYPSSLFYLVGPIDKGNPEAIPPEKLEQWNKEGIVKYIGPVEDVRTILKKAHYLVHPILHREGIPRVLLEANAMGVPCITTDTPGCRDVIIDGYNGFVIPPNNTKALTEKIINLIEKPVCYSDFKVKCRAHIQENFSLEKTIKTYLSKLNL